MDCSQRSQPIARYDAHPCCAAPYRIEAAQPDCRPLGQRCNRGGLAVIDRSEVARAMAKAIAYKQCGKQKEAEQWARELVRLLECADILR